MTAAKAMRALVDFMATDKAHEGVSKNVTIYGQAFHNLDAFALVLQVTVQCTSRAQVTVQSLYASFQNEPLRSCQHYMVLPMDKPAPSLFGKVFKPS